jgi:hypothetical protein
MSYALLFSRGENGWGTNNESLFGGMKLRFPTYLASRLLRNEEIEASSLMDPTYPLLTNRFQVMAHLGQMYTVDAVSCMIDTKLKFTRNNQDMITGAQRNDVQKEDKSELLSLTYILYTYLVNVIYNTHLVFIKYLIVVIIVL